MGSTKVSAVFFTCLIFTLTALPPAYAWKKCCCPPGYPPYHRPSPPKTPRHPHPPKTPSPRPPTTPRPRPPTVKPPPKVLPPIFTPPPIITPPPVISPPVITPPPTNPPVINPPVITPTPPSSGYPPYTPCPPGGGGGGRPPSPAPITKCPIDALKLGLCLDVLGGLVHVIIGDPVQNICCPVIQGLLELEAAICLCTTIRLKLLNLNIFLPIALQVLATCGYNPPPGFVCPPLP